VSASQTIDPIHDSVMFVARAVTVDKQDDGVHCGDPFL
jgi:hypothetical protein